MTNHRKQAHDLAIDGGVQSRKLGAGESQSLDLGLVSEGLHMFCTQSLHEFLGMKLQHIQIVRPDGPVVSSTMFATPPSGGVAVAEQ